eukprot:6986322-Pyramimonas_sp.AAC.1
MIGLIDVGSAPLAPAMFETSSIHGMKRLLPDIEHVIALLNEMWLTSFPTKSTSFSPSVSPSSMSRSSPLTNRRLPRL